MKELNWDLDFVVPLTVNFKDFEQKYNIKLPDDLVENVSKYNAGTVEPHRFDLENEKGKVFSGFLSFNDESTDGEDLVCETIDSVGFYKDSKLIALPFGLDPFGNLICLKDNKIYFWNHEEDDFIYISETLTDFLNMLY